MTETTKSWKDIIAESKKVENEFKPLPEGDYDFVISKSEAVKTKTGKDMFKIQAKVIHGDHARRVVFQNMVLSYESPVAMNIFLRQMAVLGLDEAYFAADPTVEQTASELVGRVFRGKVVITSDPNYRDGEPQNEIKNYSTPSAEARQLALSVPTANNPVPAQSPTSGGAAPASAAPSPATPPAPAATPPAPAPETVSAPPVAPPPAPATSGTIPAPPPAPVNF